MRLTDPVADMLTRIRNAIRARHQKVDVPASKLKLEIARILKEEGYISNFKPAEEEGHKVLRIYLKYGNNNEAAISNVERVSRPGLYEVRVIVSSRSRVFLAQRLNASPLKDFSISARPSSIWPRRSSAMPRLR